MNLTKILAFLFFLLFNLIALGQDSTAIDILEKKNYMILFKHYHYEKQVATYDSLDWCSKVDYFEEVTHLPNRKRKKIKSLFYTYMLEELIFKTHYTSCESGHVGYMWTSETVKHDIAVWRKILNCE